MEAVPLAEEPAHKKGRHRKKQLYNSILQQMEFYFSDSNLTKDRFLSQLIKTDPYIALSTFLDFNKIRKLTTSIEDITKAVGNSTLIELSADKTRVCRKAPVQAKENVDECTVYVERLKSDVTHEWLTTIFSEFGSVVYVSIPKYKHNGMIKGFAFVEFEREADARAAMEYFESIECTIPPFMEPQKLCSIATYEGDAKKPGGKPDNKRKEDVQEKPCKAEVKEVTKQLLEEPKKSANDHEEKFKTKKRKHSEEKVGEPNKKKSKAHAVSESGEDCQPAEVDPKEKSKKSRKSSETREKKKRKHSESETSEASMQKKSDNQDDGEVDQKKQKVDGSEQEATSEGEAEEKKKKKHKKSHRKKINLKEIGLQILSKKDWKKMRNRYLDMQKKSMQELKKHLNRQRFARRYENHPRQPIKETETVQQDNQPKTHFIPGIIVKISLTEPCEENKKLKNEIKACSSDIQFVDIPTPAGSTEVYIRFSENKNAQGFCESNFNKGKSAILDGDEEKHYWERIEASKQAKLKHNLGKQRGRDKLLKKAEKQIAKHVRFDDSE